MTKKSPSWVISTVVSQGDFEYFIPIFSYSILKAYPEADVKIFLKGVLNPEVSKWIPNNTKVYEEMFLDVPDRVSTCNTLRHFIPRKYFRDYNYVYNTDVDFIIFNHKVTHVRYYSKIMKQTNLSYAGARGPLTGPRRPEITPSWDGAFKRIAAGCLMLSARFYAETTQARKKYRKLIRSGHKETCGFREYDEVVFQRICTESGIRTPIKKNCFANGEKMSARFRDIHLGDFKFPHRWKNRGKMKRILLNENVKNFRELEKDKKWLKTVEAMSECEMVSKYFKRLRKHVNGRD